MDSRQPVRSQWERDTESHIRAKYPNLEIFTNDRRIIPSRSTSKKLEIDIFIPSICLGIELNGESYHNHAQYARDKQNGTVTSDEAYKEQYCQSEGILLLNLWSSQPEKEILDQIDSAISSRINDSSITPYEFKNKIPAWLQIVFFLVAIPLWLIAAITLLGILDRSLIGGHSEYYGYVWCQPLMLGSLATALLFAFGCYIGGRDSTHVPFKIALSLVLLFGTGSGLSLYTTICEQEPFTGYLAPDKYRKASPLSKTTVGHVYVEDDLVYWCESSDTMHSPGLKSDTKQAITELGYEGDAESICAEAFSEAENKSANIGLPRASTGKLFGYTTFLVNDSNYTLAVTLLDESQNRYTYYHAYIYQS